MPDTVTHPTPQQLAAFGLGKLPERAAAAIAAHLEVCSGCRNAVANLPPDSFLAKVRAPGRLAPRSPRGRRRYCRHCLHPDQHLRHAARGHRRSPEQYPGREHQCP